MKRRDAGLLIAGWAALFLVTVGVGELLPDSGVPSFDRPVLRGIAHHRSAWWTHVMRIVTTVGSPAYVLGAAALAALVLLARREVSGAVFVLAAAGGVDADDSLAKLIVQRARPHLSRVPNVSAHGYSFPSGHATVATGGLLAIAVVVALRSRGRVRALVLAAAGIAAALVGFSRLYLGVHWPTDVLAGWVIGVVWVTLTLRVVLGRSRRAAVS